MNTYQLIGRYSKNNQVETVPEVSFTDKGVLKPLYSDQLIEQIKDWFFHTQSIEPSIADVVNMLSGTQDITTTTSVFFVIIHKN